MRSLESGCTYVCIPPMLFCITHQSLHPGDKEEHHQREKECSCKHCQENGFQRERRKQPTDPAADKITQGCAEEPYSIFVHNTSEQVLSLHWVRLVPASSNGMYDIVLMSHSTSPHQTRSYGCGTSTKIPGRKGEAWANSVSLVFSSAYPDDPNPGK